MWPALAGIVTALGCGRSDTEGLGVPGLGDRCMPMTEQRKDFSGFSETEVTLESGHEQCETRLCLIHHLRGRVSCPYGQSEAEALQVDTAANWGIRCRVPGTDGSRPEDRVQVPVPAQKFARQPETAVYCSCRCADTLDETDGGADYCHCPRGFTCTHLTDDIGLGPTELTGSFCVKTTGEYDETEVEASPDCTFDRSYPGGWQEHPYQCGPPVPE